MNIIDRFVEYVKIPTMSDPNSDTYPSSSTSLLLPTTTIESISF
mgnify:CR=1 FL=1